MYLLTKHDNWLIGRMHQHLDHDCTLTEKGYCSAYESLENAFMGAKNDEEQAYLNGMFGASEQVVQ